jgi:hypothetical protein
MPDDGQEASALTPTSDGRIEATPAPRRRWKRGDIDPISKRLGAAAIQKTFFVPYHPPNKASSKKNAELVDAARRSYIARRWHDKRYPLRQAKESIPAVESSRVPAQPDILHSDGTLPHDKTSMITRPNQDITSVEHLPLNTRSFSPFSGFALEVNESVFRTFEYFTTIWSRTAFRSPINEQGLIRNTESSIASLIQRVTADRLTAHAFLAAVAMRMATVHATRAAAESHAASALQELRVTIASTSAPADQIVPAILFLAAYETYCYNLAGARSHLRALRQFGAPDVLSSDLRTLCRNIDLFTAASHLLPPVFPPSRTLTFTTTPANTAFGKGFTDFEHILGQGMLRVVAQIAACAETAERLSTTTTGPHSVMPMALTDFMASSQSLTFDLLAQLPGSPLKEATIIALLIWFSYLPIVVMTSSYGVTNTRRPPTNAGSTDYLKLVPGRGASLVSRLRTCALNSPLELWILAVGIVCAVDRHDVAFCAIAFSSLGLQLSILPQDLYATLRRFLWLRNFDYVDVDVLAELLSTDPKVREQGIDKVVSWAAITTSGLGGSEAVGGGGIEGNDLRGKLVRVTNRPSNLYRLGA